MASKFYSGVLNAGNAPQMSEGTYAAIPSAGLTGSLYFATDQTKMYRDNGSTWDLWFQSGGGTTGAWLQNGNSFGSSGNLGTNDNYPVNIYTNSLPRAQFATSGAFNINNFSNLNYGFFLDGNGFSSGTAYFAPNAALTGLLMNAYSGYAGKFLDFHINGSNSIFYVDNLGQFNNNNSVNGNLQCQVYNTSSGTNAAAVFSSQNNGGGQFQLAKYGNNYSNYLNIRAGDGNLYNGVYGNISITNAASNRNINFATGGVATPQLTIFPSGNVSIGGGFTDNGYSLDVRTSGANGGIYNAGTLTQQGNLIFGSGSKIVIPSGGANARQGTATFAASATITISTTAVTVKSIIYITCIQSGNAVGGTISVCYDYTITAGVQFTITAYDLAGFNNSCTDTIGWVIFDNG